MLAAIQMLVAHKVQVGRDISCITAAEPLYIGLVDTHWKHLMALMVIPSTVLTLGSTGFLHRTGLSLDSFGNGVQVTAID